jgi:hypothetical protein
MRTINQANRERTTNQPRLQLLERLLATTMLEELRQDLAIMCQGLSPDQEPRH